MCTDEDYVDWVNINHPGFLPTTSDVQIPVHTEPSVSDTLAASRMTILSDSPLTDVVDSGSSTLTEPNVSDVIVIPTDTLPKNPTTLLTDITNVSEHQSTTTLTPTATANQPPKSSSPISEYLELPLTHRCSKKGKKPGPARVLTSQQSLEMLVEKGRKKQEEEAEKERKKREREEKRKLRAEMNMRKAEERKVRIEERKRKAEEKAQEQELKRLEREKKKELEFKCKEWEQKKNSGFSKTFITRSKTRDSCAPPERG